MFFRLLNWFILRQLCTHYWRLLAVLFGIGLGSAVFTSVRLAVDASLDSFTQSMDLISSKADWVVTRPGGRVSEGLVSKLLSQDAVETASPLLTAYVRTTHQDAEPFLLIGLDPILDRPLRTWQIESPSEKPAVWLDLLRIPGTLLASPRLAQRQGFTAGKSVSLVHVHQVNSFRVLGLLEPRGLALVDGGLVAITDISTMQEFTGRQGWVDRIDLKVKPNAGKEDMARIKALLPPGVVMDPPSETRETGETMIRAYQFNLSVLSFVSLFVGMFLVYSLVAFNAASRRRELAVLRSLGGSSRLVFSLVLAEGAVLGMLGWLLAIPIGSFLVRYLVKGVSDTITNLFVRVHVEGLDLDPWEILLSLLVTNLVCLLAAYGPARETTRIAPKEAMTMQNTPAGENSFGRRLTVGAIVLIALALPLSQLPSPAGFPLFGYVAILILVLGFSLLAPLILRWIGTYMPPLLRRTMGEPAFLGARYVRDAGKRTAISVGALITAMALYVSLVIMVNSFRHTVELWVDQTLTGDLFIRPAMAGFNEYRDALPEETILAIRELPLPVELLPYRRLYLRFGNHPYELEAMDFDLTLRYTTFILLDGNLAEISPQLTAGRGVLVSEVFANKTGLRTGDLYRVQLGESTLEAPILGVCRDYRTRGGVVFMDLAAFQQGTGDLRWSGIRFFFTDRNQDLKAAIARLRVEIFRCCAKSHPLEMISGVELRREVLRIFDETFAVTTVLLLIALFVAGLGITTTLTVSVLQRLRQLNTLAAVGASSGQLRSMIFWEAVFMVASGEGLGFLCGLVLSHLLISVINLQSFGWTFLFHADWNSLLTSLPLILATALVAALPATRLAVRSSPALILKET